MAVVATDLFNKGSPELRVAEYANRAGFTDQQFSNFLEKLDCLPEETKYIIHTHFRDLGKGDCRDKARYHGMKLRDWCNDNIPP